MSIDDLKDVLDALWDARSKWDRIGLQLNFREPDLAAIAERFRGDPNHCLMEMIILWLKQVSLPPPTWKSIINALKHRTVGEKELAQRVAQRLRFEDEGSRYESNAMLKLNLSKIKYEFAKLQLDVQRALDSGEAKGTIEDVYHYLVTVFQCDIPSASFTDMFVSITLRGLWNYRHYSPLENFIEEFLPSRNNRMLEYKNSLAGFQATTKLVHYIEKASLPLTGVDQEYSIEKSCFSKEDYRKLSVRLNLKQPLSEVSLKYMEDLWSDLAQEFELPSLTAVIKRILEG